ncbi:MAG: hypothetical protein V4666_04330 [Bacteroidota bacterium]
MKKVVIGFVVLMVGLFLVYKYLYHEHRDIATEAPSFSVTVNQLLKEFTENETKANSKYLDKSINIKGKITSVDNANKTIVLDEKVFVMLTTPTDIKMNSEISVQGRLIGYDSLLEEIKLDQAQIK